MTLDLCTDKDNIGYPPPNMPPGIAVALIFNAADLRQFLLPKSGVHSGWSGILRSITIGHKLVDPVLAGRHPRVGAPGKRGKRGWPKALELFDIHGAWPALDGSPSAATIDRFSHP
jgi:hypothetical protein